MAQASVALRAQAPGAVRAVVEHIDSRPVVVARMDASERRGALSSTASATLAEAASGPAPALGRMSVAADRPAVGRAAPAPKRLPRWIAVAAAVVARKAAGGRQRPLH